MSELASFPGPRASFRLVARAIEGPALQKPPLPIKAVGNLWEGMTLFSEATREAGSDGASPYPELRPTCAGLPRQPGPCKFALISCNPGLSPEAPLGRRTIPDLALS
jgi:hypothetical protein